MTASNDYAVFFFPQALEALGGAIEPFLRDGPSGPHVLCHEIDTSGALLEMTIQGINGEGDSVLRELMVPASMVRMIVSSQSDAAFGFGPRLPQSSQQVIPGVAAGLAPVRAQSDATTGSKAKAKRSKPKKRKSKS